jgi:hypothetical protein
MVGQLSDSAGADCPSAHDSPKSQGCCEKRLIRRCQAIAALPSALLTSTQS